MTTEQYNTLCQSEERIQAWYEYGYYPEYSDMPDMDEEVSIEV